CLKTLKRRYPGFENLDPANRTINTALPRRHESGGPRRTDAPDKYEPGVGSGRGLDRNFGVANLVLANHYYLPTMTSEAFIIAHASSPTLRPRSATASLVMEAVIIDPCPISMLTCDVVAPAVTATTLPLS